MTRPSDNSFPSRQSDAVSDGAFVRQILSGRVESYGPLAHRWAARVLAVCHARVGRADAAEDLAQEALLRGLRALPTLTDPEKFGPWLCGIAVRCCLDWLKASARTEVSMSTLPASDDPAFDRYEDDLTATIARREEIGRLMAEIERLPLPIRQVLMHFYYEDCTYKQIAEHLGISTATVNLRLTTARHLLRQRLARNPPQC